MPEVAGVGAVVDGGWDTARDDLTFIPHSCKLETGPPTITTV